MAVAGMVASTTTSESKRPSELATDIFIVEQEIDVVGGEVSYDQCHPLIMSQELLSSAMKPITVTMTTSATSNPKIKRKRCMYAILA